MRLSMLALIIGILLGSLILGQTGVTQTQTELNYIFPRIPAYRTDGPPVRPRFSLEIPPPVVPNSFNVYTVRPISVNETYVRRLALLFGMRAQVQPLRNGKWEVVEGAEDPPRRRTLTVYEASGGFSYMFDNLIFMATEDQPKLPSEGEAFDLAVRFLKERLLLPRDAVVDSRRVRFSKPTLIERNAREQRTIREIVTDIEVRFPRILNGYNVRGPGAKLYVTFGHGGQIVGVARIWREVEKAERELASIRPTEALRLLEQGAGVLDVFPDCVRAAVTSMQLIYWMEEPKSQQRVVLPAYRLEGRCLSSQDKVLGDFQAYAPAVRNAPFGR